jgi:hypothetical protein
MTSISRLDIDERQRLASLLDPRSPADAAAEYYALHHAAERTRLYAIASNQGRPKGFMAVAQTGLDLFRPLLVPFVGQSQALERLVEEVLPGIGAGILRIPAYQLSWLDGAASVEGRNQYEILRLASDQFEPTLNVLVVEAQTPGGGPRYEVRTADGEFAAAGLNWSGSRFAEIYLEASQGARSRRLTRSVLSAILSRLLGERRQPLYLVNDSDPTAKTEAFQLGFRPTAFSVVLADITVPDDGAQLLEER